MKFTILTDADGCLVDFLTAYLNAYNWLNGRACTREDVTDFNFAKCLGSKEDDDKVWRHIDTTPGFVLGLSWHPGAKEGLAELRKLCGFEGGAP